MPTYVYPIELYISTPLLLQMVRENGKNVPKM